MYASRLFASLTSVSICACALDGTLHSGAIHWGLEGITLYQDLIQIATRKGKHVSVEGLHA